MDLVRAILLAAEGEEGVDFGSWSDEQVKYHKALVVEAGLARGKVHWLSESRYPSANVVGLTWAGHEFLDTARDDSVWNRARDAVAGKLAGVSLTVLQNLLTRLAMDRLGLP
jgi:hypothetical protein